MDFWKLLVLYLLMCSSCRLHKTAKVDFCQNSPDKLLLRDLRLSRGSGILHKFDDFLEACEIAIRSNRVLVDYVSKLNPVLGFMALYGSLEKHHGKGEIVLPWKFGNFFNLSNFEFNVQYKNVSSVRSSISSVISFRVFCRVITRPVDSNLAQLQVFKKGQV